MAKRGILGGIWAVLMSAGVLMCGWCAAAEHPREIPRKVEKVTFLGAKHVKEEELRNLTGVRLGMILNPKLNRQGCQRVRDKYEEMGRPLAKCELVKGGDLNDTEVVYQITEGSKVTVREIQFKGNTFASGARLLTQIKSVNKWFGLIGGTYNKPMALAIKAQLEENYRGFGYQDVRVDLKTKWSEDRHGVTLIFHIHEGSRYRVQRVPDVRGTLISPRERP